MDFNYYANGESNFHMHGFITSCQRWIILWIRQKASHVLHGQEFMDIILINLFDEDTNKFIPFENTLVALI